MVREKKKEERTTDDHGHPKRGEDPKKYQCGVCRGSGMTGNKKCWNCDGEGEV